MAKIKCNECGAEGHAQTHEPCEVCGSSDTVDAAPTKTVLCFQGEEYVLTAEDEDAEAPASPR